MLLAQLLHLVKRQLVEHAVLVKLEGDHVVVFNEEGPVVDDRTSVQLLKAEPLILAHGLYCNLALLQEVQASGIITPLDEAVVLEEALTYQAVDHIVLRVVRDATEVVHPLETLEHELLLLVLIGEDLVLQGLLEGWELKQDFTVLLVGQLGKGGELGADDVGSPLASVD